MSNNHQVGIDIKLLITLTNKTKVQFYASVYCFKKKKKKKLALYKLKYKQVDQSEEVSNNIF